MEHVRARRHRQHRRAPARARASRAWSSATTSAAARPPTARCSTARPAPSAPRPSRRASSRACARPATWARTGSPQQQPDGGARGRARTTSWSSRARCPAAGGGYVVIRKKGIGTVAEKKKARRAPPRPRARPRSRGQEARRTRSRKPTTADVGTRRPKRLRQERGASTSSNASNEKVSDIVLHPDVFGVARERAPPLRGGQAVPRRRPRGHARDQEPRPGLAARARSPGGRRAPAAPASARPARPSGGTAARCSGPSPATTPTPCRRRRARPPCAPPSASAPRTAALKVVDRFDIAEPKTQGAEGHPRQARRRGQDAARRPQARRTTWSSPAATSRA